MNSGINKFHKKCFVCGTCSNPIQGPHVYKKDIGLTCKSCLDKKKKEEERKRQEEEEEKKRETEKKLIEQKRKEEEEEERKREEMERKEKEKKKLEEKSEDKKLEPINLPEGFDQKKTCVSCLLETKIGDKLAALGYVYHKSCFNCQICHKEFENMKFFALDNRPVCKECKKKN
jgi:flagellar biosynthesis GTPase FlhF